MRVHRALFRAARAARGQNPVPAVVIMDGQQVEDHRKGGTRGFDGQKRIKGRKRQSWSMTRGVLVACRVEPAGMSDRRAGRSLTGGLRPLWPRIRTVIADAGDVCGKLARHIEEHEGWSLGIIMRPRPGFEIVGPDWIAERTPDRVRGRLFAWLGRHRRLSKDHGFRVQTSEELIAIAACAPMLKRPAPG